MMVIGIKNMNQEINIDKLKYKIQKYYKNYTNNVQFHKTDIIALEELIRSYEELDQLNKELLLRLRADGLIDRDKYWIKKIKGRIELFDNLIKAHKNTLIDASVVKQEFEKLLTEADEY